MLSRQDLTSPSRQDKNAGNSGDLVKHTVYLAMLNHLARNGKKAHIVEAHGGKGVYVSSNPHLRRAREAAQYSTSVLGRAQAECFAAPPGGLGVVADLAKQEVGYAGSGALHANAVANGLAVVREMAGQHYVSRFHLSAFCDPVSNRHARSLAVDWLDR